MTTEEEDKANDYKEEREFVCSFLGSMHEFFFLSMHLVAN